MIYNYYNPYMMQQPTIPPFSPDLPPFAPGRPVLPPEGPSVPPFIPPGSGPQVPVSSPTSPPPPFIPETAPYRVDPASIRRCRRKYTYLWLENGQRFWFYPIYIGRTSISGYRWIGFTWVLYGTDLRQIQSFVCY